MKTKNTLISIILLLFNLLIYSDNYESVFGVKSTSWNILDVIFDAVITDSFYVKKDTSLNGGLYKKIENINFKETRFLRETEDKSKVFLYLPDRIDSEYLVYDMNLQLNDTFYVGINNSDTLVADSVYFLNNKKHIRFDYLVDLTAGYEKLEFIEGV